jgi:hypothetical protein
MSITKGASMRILNQFWTDDRGALISSEYLFVATILVIGTVVGLTGVRDTITVELTELGNALLALSQGFTVSGTSGAAGQTDGSQAIDTPSLVTPPTCVAPANPSNFDIIPCQ